MSSVKYLVGLIPFILLLFLYIVTDNKNVYINLKSLLKDRRQDKIVLYWNKFFGRSDYFGSGSLPFENCEVKSCFVTSNRNYVKIDEFDAIIFHGAEYSLKKDGKPVNRSSHQRYVFFDMETVANRATDSKVLVHFYNWTLTYWRKSDIYFPYGYFIEEETNYTIPDVNYLKNKTKSVAWFVSNCKSKSNREAYVKELQKYIDVDIYGKCGTKTCSRSTEQKCYEMLERDYWFYLSFENSFCEDYVTEKLYHLIKYNIVPVVRGLGNYEELAPPFSVINTADYESPKDLANYLFNLKNNSVEYLKYFQWKKNYTIATWSFTRTMCELCLKLHEDTEVKTYNLADWWQKNCIDYKTIKIT